MLKLIQQNKTENDFLLETEIRKADFRDDSKKYAIWNISEFCLADLNF